MKEKKDRVDDSLRGSHDEEGIVPGGGTALLKCVDLLHTGVIILKMKMRKKVLR